MTTLLVASTGGHLTQLSRLAPRLRGGLDEDFVWVTFDTPQSRSMLSGQDVVFVEHTHSRDWRNLVRNALGAGQVLDRRQVRGVVSTGAGIALAFIPLARARRLPCHFIESAARSIDASLTARVLGAVPGVALYSQYPERAGGRWHYAGSVFDPFRSEERTGSPAPIRRVVVTLGTIERYGFRRLVERLLNLLPRSAETLWQTGATDVSGLPISARPSLPWKELATALGEADLVVAHAGVGSALAALEASRCPLLVPRRKRHGEHVDDHQIQVARELARRGLAVTRSVQDLGHEDLLAAAGRTVTTIVDPPPFRLTGT